MSENPNVKNFIKNWLAEERRDFQFEHEIKTARLVHSAKRSRKEVVDFINSLPILLEDEASSHDARLLGNAKFKLADPVSIAESLDLYTKAICHAPPQSQALALAHGNRATALFKLGKFETAYNDCQCALDLNHPKRNIMMLRQAMCARSMSDATKLAICIAEMDKLNISDSSLLDGFRSDLNKMNEDPTTNSATENPLPIVEKKQKIIRSEGGARHVFAEESIKRGDIICTDEPYVFVPFSEVHKIPFNKDQKIPFCDNCSQGNIIVFPCNACQRVFYCTPRCREEHVSIHNVECNGYQINLFGQIGHFAHLALRAMLKVLASILDKMRNHHRESGAKQLKNAKQLLDRILDMMQNEGLMDTPTSYNRYEHFGYIIYQAQISALLCGYLSEKTRYFEETQNLRRELMGSEYQWKIVFVALLLRFISQIEINAESPVEMFPKEKFISRIVTPGGMYAHTILTRPYVGFYPRIVFYRHSCAANTTTATVKGKVFVVALSDIEAGQELFSCYTSHVGGVLPRDARKAELKRFGITCKCSECLRDTDDRYDRFNRVVCRQNGCNKIFVPNRDNFALCPRCGVQFQDPVTIKFELSYILSRESVVSYKQAIEYYLIQSRYLPQYTTYRILIALTIVNKFLSCDSPCIMRNDDISRHLLDMAIEISVSTEEMGRIGAQFLYHSNYALDIIALRKVNGLDRIDKRAFVEKMKRAIMFLSPEIRRIYEKYMDEYVN